MPKYDVEKCMLCGGCEAVCEGNAIILTPVYLEYEPRRCKKCKKCANICPSGAWRAK
ncbi:MAG: 4Fe-4S binding protein [Thermoplasmata archaeon]